VRTSHLVEILATARAESAEMSAAIAAELAKRVDEAPLVKIQREATTAALMLCRMRFKDDQAGYNAAIAAEKDARDAAWLRRQLGS